MLRVIGIGDNVCDKYVHSGIMYPGGQALNFSVYARLLGNQSSYLGVFGRDPVASHILSVLDELQVEHGRCRQYEGENGYARVGLENGDRVFLESNKGGIAKEKPLVLTAEDLAYIKGFDLVHTSNNSHFNTQLPALKQTKVPVSYDFSGQWREEACVREVAPYIDFAFLSCGGAGKEEVKGICRDIYMRGSSFVTATRGSEGAILYDGDVFYEQQPRLVKAVDTLGAGDSYAAAFLLSFLAFWRQQPRELEKRGDSYKQALKAAMRSGADFAAETCMMQGAFGHGVSFTEGKTEEVTI